MKKTLGPVSLDGAGHRRGDRVRHLHRDRHGDRRQSCEDRGLEGLADPRPDRRVVHHTSGAVAGRPGAGPALALSLVLVAIVCALTGLCYAELASMIPIAGSAYTYTYATLGELIAWVIGWDLILEYAFSNMSVSVGFAAHVVALLDWIGIPLSPKWLSPAYLPLGLAGSAGQGYLRGRLACGIQHSRVPDRAAADGSAGARHSRVGANQQHHGAGEDCGDPAVRLLRPELYSSGELHSLLAEWMVGRAGGRVDHLLHLYRVRFGLDGQRGVQAAPARCADRDSGDAD